MLPKNRLACPQQNHQPKEVRVSRDVSSWSDIKAQKSTKKSPKLHTVSRNRLLYCSVHTQDADRILRLRATLHIKYVQLLVWGEEEEQPRNSCANPCFCKPYNFDKRQNVTTRPLLGNRSRSTTECAIKSRRLL